MPKEPLLLHQAAFSHGEVSPFLFGRVDLQAYSSSLRTSRNAFIRTEGSWSNRPGTQFCGVSPISTAYGSVLIPFTFNVGQTYILEMGAGTITLWSEGALINTGVNPYTLADLRALRYSQSADTLTIVHPKYPPMEFKRTSATTFTFLAGVYTLGPYLQQNTDGTTFVYASAQSGNVTLTASAPIFKAGHVGGLFQLTQQDLSQIPPWEADKRLNPQIGGVQGILGLLRRSNGKNYKCVGYPGPVGALAINTGTFAPDHSQGTQADGDGNAIPNGPDAAGVNWQYTDSGFGSVLITAFIDSTHVQATVQPNYTGGPGILPLAVTGGPQSADVGPWNFTGDGTTTTFTLATSTSFDPNEFLVTVNGLYQNPSLYSLNESQLVFLGAPANNAAIVVTQITTLGQTTFWAFGAFSPDQGYPSAVTYFPDRLIFAATPQQPVGVFGSQTSIYHNYGVSQPVVNSDAFTVFLNARQLNAISDLVPLQDLIVGTANIIWRLSAGSTGTALGPLAIQATPQAFLGESPSCAAVLYGDSMIYPIYGGRRLRDFIYQFQFDKYMGSELTAYSRHLVPFGTQIVRLMYAPDPWSFLYALRSDGVLLCCTYVREQQMIAWSHWDTNGVIEDIALVPENNSYALYMIVNRNLPGGVSGRYIEVLTQWETETIFDYKFMDCSLTYDGRNTSETTMKVTGGTTWLAGDVGTITASSATGWAGFKASDVTYLNQIQLFDAAGNRARVLLTDIVSPTVAKVRFADPLPADLQGAQTVTWTFARTFFQGLTQLANQPLSVIADANVVMGKKGVPSVVAASDGSFTLQTAAGVVCAGLQYLSDFETMQLNAEGQATIRSRTKGIPRLHLDVTGTRGLAAGTDFTKLTEFKERAFEPYTSATDTQEGIMSQLLYTEFDSEAHVCVRQAYPLPVTIRMVIPDTGIGQDV